MATSIALGWTSNLIGSVVLDLIADNIAGADGDAVSMWDNYAPNRILFNNRFSQATGAKQPTLKRNILNGHSTVLFNGTSHFLLSDSGTFSVNSAGYTLAVVYQLTSTAGGVLSNFLDENGHYHNDQLVGPPSGPYQPYSFMSQVPTVGATMVGIANALDTNAHLFIRTYNGGTNTAPASYSSALDGSAKSVVASSTFALGVTTKCSVGADVSPAGVGSGFFAGHIARLIAFKAVLSAADQLNLTTYLRRLYGI